MVDGPDVRSRKRDWTRTEIVAAAWELARHEGVAAVSLRELAAKVGMRAPSLYTYFPSKNELYDAMYAQGMRELAVHLSTSPPGNDAKETLRNRAKTWVTAASQDAFRYELLFQRPIPGFAPSAESLAIGLAGLGETRKAAEAAGLRGDRAFDLFIATTRGLVEMQIANEPGGGRWIGLVGEAVDNLIARYAPRDRRRVSGPEKRGRATGPRDREPGHETGAEKEESDEQGPTDT